MTEQVPSEERCPDCGRAKHEHTPVEDFPCGHPPSKDLSTCVTHAAEHRMRDTLPCPWCVIDELKRNRDVALQRVDALTLELENTSANLVKAIRAAHEPPAALQSVQTMFRAAVSSLAEISKALDIPDHVASVANGNAEILKAIAHLKRAAQPPPADDLPFLLFHVLDELSMYEDFTRNEVADHLRAELTRRGIERPTSTKGEAP